MKQRIIATLIIMCVCMISFWNCKISVYAEDDSNLPVGTEEDIDVSYFTSENSLIGYANIPRGVYLASGNSSIRKISAYKIGVGGTTNAAVRCDVSVTTMVERYNTTTGSWVFVTSWKQTNENAFSAVISKALIVATNNQYRVRSSHYAGTDSSSSCTNALLM